MALIISFQNSNVVFKKASDWLIEGIYCICYDLQAAKLHTSGLSLPALEMIQYYLLNRKQKKNEFSYTTWENFISGASQGYIWRFILFIIIVCDLSLEHEDCCKNAADVIDILLTSITQKLFTWLANNQIKANHNKCHLLLITKEEQTFRFPIWQ